MTTRKTKKKIGRPASRNPKPKPERAYLDTERQRQLGEIIRRNGGSKSAAISHAISFHYAHLKKEWPDDFD